MFMLNPYLGEQNKCKHGFGGKEKVEITKDRMSWLILAAFAKEINMNRDEKNIQFFFKIMLTLPTGPPHLSRGLRKKQSSFLPGRRALCPEYHSCSP